MADVPVPSIATVTPALADTLLGVQSGAVKRMSVGALPLTTAAQAQITALGYSAIRDGAVGDGITDDTLALRAAITAAGVGGTLVFPAGSTFLLSGALTPLAGQTWIMHGATLKRRNSISTTTTTPITSGVTNSIVVADASNFRVGMSIAVYTSPVSGTSNVTISAIVGNTITTSTPFNQLSLPSGGTVITSHMLVNSPVADNFSIHGGIFNGNRANNASYTQWPNHVDVAVAGANSIVDGLYIYDSQGDGLECFGDATSPGTKPFHATNCRVENTNGNGIHTSGSQGATVTQCYVKNANLRPNGNIGHDDGCIIFSNGTAESIIANNYCENGICGIGSIDSDDNSNVVISGNIIKNCTVSAIEGIFPATTKGGKVVITGNLIFDSVKVEMNFTPAFAVGSGPYDWVFSGNYLENTRLALAKGFGLLVANNIITSAADTTNVGITVDDCRRVSISGNQITGFSNGCYVSGTNSAAVKVSDNTLVNQYTRGVGIGSTATGPAISVEGCTVVVESGYVTAAGYIGISASNNLAVLNNVMNIQTTSSNAAIECPNGSSGVNGAIVQGNVIRSAGLAYAIRAYGGSQNNFIVGNYTQQSIQNSGGGSNTVTGNYTIY